MVASQNGEEKKMSEPNTKGFHPINKKMTFYKKRKAIIAYHFESQRRKDRGERLNNEIGAFLTSMEIELMADLKKLQKDPEGDLYKIIPKPKTEEELLTDYKNSKTNG